MALQDFDIDWFGIATDPENDLTKKCAFCKDSNRNPLEEPDSEANSYATTDCRHLICGVCQKLYVAGQVSCPLCGQRIQRYNKKDLPEYLSLKVLNEIRREIYKEWNLTSEDFKSNSEFNRFLEQREDIVRTMLYARSLSKEGRKPVEELIRTKRSEFMNAHREAITKNDAKLAEHRSKIKAAIDKEAAEVKKFLKRTEIERREEELKRIRKEQEKNDKKLGTVTHIVETKVVENNFEEEARTYLFSANDPLSINSPPKLIKESTPAVTDVPIDEVHLAGGLSLAAVRSRLLAEMASGWDLLV